MIPVQKLGKGLSGCVRYVLGEGRDKETKRLRPAAANDDESRVAWISGQGFGWTPENRDGAEMARRIMEYGALHQKSKTKPCEKDCLHLVLSWRDGEKPSREEMETAAREALKALGMEKARALFVAHNDTDHAHLHIVASRINPETGLAFRDSYSQRALQAWALKWEQERGNVQCLNREKRSQLDGALARRDADAVLDLLTQRQATFTARELGRELGRVLGREGAEGFRAEILGRADVIPLYDRATGARVERFTTVAVRASEQDALTDGAALAAHRRHRVDTAPLAAALAQYPTLRPEQRRAFDHATGAEGLALIVGKAGTGKSYVMGAVRAAYDAQGCRVVGLAPTNAVAQDMQRDGFTEARTIHSALFALKNGRDAWDGKTVLMVDEAAMMGTRLTAELLAQARAAGAKVVLWSGTTASLPAWSGAGCSGRCAKPTARQRSPT